MSEDPNIRDRRANDSDTPDDVEGLVKARPATTEPDEVKKARNDEDGDAVEAHVKKA